MTYLTHEIALLQGLSRNFDATIAQLNASAALQDQAASAAQARAAQARADVTRLNAQAATLQSQAAVDDAQVASFNGQIATLAKSEPPRTILGEGTNGGRKPVPNPDWKVWSDQMNKLAAQRNAAQAAAAAAHTSATQSSAAAAQAQTTAASADHDAATAKANASSWRQQAAQVSIQKDQTTQQIATITRWQQKIAQQPMDRSALEGSGVEIAGYLANLEDQYAAALDQVRAADQRQWYLQTLTQELTTKISDLNSQLLPAAKEVADATAALNDTDRRLEHVMRRQPE